MKKIILTAIFLVANIFSNPSQADFDFEFTGMLTTVFNAETVQAGDPIFGVITVREFGPLSGASISAPGAVDLEVELGFEPVLAEFSNGDISIIDGDTDAISFEGGGGLFEDQTIVAHALIFNDSILGSAGMTFNQGDSTEEIFAAISDAIAENPSTFVYSLITDSSQILMFGNIDSIVPVVGCEVTLGDINDDGTINLLDVSPFVDLITSNQFVCQADINDDDVVDLLDVEPFIELFLTN